MIYVILWVAFACLVGYLSNEKTIGFWGGFLISLLLSPVIGLIIYAVSMDKSEKIRLIQQQWNIQQQSRIIHQQQLTNNQSISNEIEKLKKQMDEGVITPEEFQALKNKIIST